MDAQRGIARRMVIGLPPDGLSAAWERDFSAYPPAGVILFSRNIEAPEQVAELNHDLQSLSSELPPSIMMYSRFS